MPAKKPKRRIFRPVAFHREVSSIGMNPSFAQRRTQFLNAIGSGIAVIPAGHEVTRNADNDYPFRQDSDFWFLTGFGEPESIAVFDPTHSSEQYVLFVRPRDRDLEIWNGYRAGVKGAIDDFAADAAYPLSDFADEMRRRLVGKDAVFVRPGSTSESDVRKALDGLGFFNERFGYPVPSTMSDPTPVIADMRLRKSADEAKELRRACEVSAEGHKEAMRVARPGLYEYQVQAAMEYVYRMRGSMRDGYPAIVAGGDNACILHYNENNQILNDGDLLLIDAAAEIGQYSSDITRTFPVNGTFTAPQRAIYEIVLAAQHASFEVAAPGSTIKAVHEASERALTEGLVDLGLLPRSVEESLAMHHYREYFMHGTSHWLGLDVHDAGPQWKNRSPVLLEVGMSFTVEPGLYVDPNRDSVEFSLYESDTDEAVARRLEMGAAAAKAFDDEAKAKAESVSLEIPEEFRGIGVRIEDDLLMTQGGYENMSAGVPTSIDEIEALCAEPPLTSAIRNPKASHSTRGAQGL
jgi:Xaa-Pro aminopeptidase